MPTEREKRFLVYSIIIFLSILVIVIFSMFGTLIFLLYSYKAQAASQHSQLLQQGIAIAGLNAHITKLETTNLILISNIKSDINTQNIALFVGAICAVFLAYSIFTNIHVLKSNVKGLDTKLTLRDQSLVDHRNYLDDKANLFSEQTDIFKNSNQIIFRELNEFKDSLKLTEDVCRVGGDTCANNYNRLQTEILGILQRLDVITDRLDNGSISNVVDTLNIAVATTPGVVEGLAAVSTLQGTVV